VHNAGLLRESVSIGAARLFYGESAMGATDRLVEFIADTHYDPLPKEIVTTAQIGIMDGGANMLGVPPSHLRRLLAHTSNSLEECRVAVSWGTISSAPSMTSLVRCLIAASAL
jgi:hypothetical protein